MTDATANKTAYNDQADPRVTAAFVRAVLDYDLDTGIFRWRARTPSEHYSEHACRVLNARDAGNIAGVLQPQNYLRVQMLDRKYLLHRLAVLHVTGQWPLGEVDHIDGNPQNNRWENLRVVSRAENRRNAARRKDNPSGVTGVAKVIGSHKWRACIRYQGKLVLLGRFDTFAAAVAERKAAEARYGFHENHGQRTRMTIRKVEERTA